MRRFIIVNIGDILDALKVLTSDDAFHIERVDYDEKNFGNIYIVLSSDKQVRIRFINDKGVFWFEIGHAEEWYFAEDVFTLIGAVPVSKNNDIKNYILEMSVLIKNNMPFILEVFNANHVNNTQIKIKTLATKRAMGMFKL